MHSIEHLNMINAPAKVVYKTLTTQEGLSQIWTEKLSVKPEVGFLNVFDFGEGYLTVMKTITLSENQEIIWQCIESDDEWTGTNVTFALSEKESTTTIILKHSQWRAITDYYRWCNCHWAMFLSRLKSHCEAIVE